MTTLTEEQTRCVISRLLRPDENHRRIIIEMINKQFLEMAMDFFANVAKAKINGLELESEDWYSSHLLANAPTSKHMGLWSGLGAKTIKNAYGSNAKEIVIEASEDNLEHFRSEVEDLMQMEGPDIILTIKMHGVGIDLTLAESLLVINAIAVMRHSLSGGTWAAVGNAVEVPLMKALCHLFSLDERYYRSGLKADGRYQVDFMVQYSGIECPCEVKLNGRGNPESVTGAIARNPKILLADFISEQNREKLNSSSIAWVDFSADGGYQEFGTALDKYGIPNCPPDDLSALDGILERLLPDPVP